MLQHINDLSIIEHMEGDFSRTAEGLWVGSVNPSFEQIWQSIVGIQVML